MSRTKAEKAALRGRAVGHPPAPRPLPPTPDVTPEQGKEAVRLLVMLAYDPIGSNCSFAMSRRWSGGTCAQENGRGWDCFHCRALYFLQRIGAVPMPQKGS